MSSNMETPDKLRVGHGKLPPVILSKNAVTAFVTDAWTTPDIVNRDFSIVWLVDTIQRMRNARRRYDLMAWIGIHVAKLGTP